MNARENIPFPRENNPFDRDSFVRNHVLMFTKGRIYQREVDWYNEVNYIDVTEEVAEAIAHYLD